MLCLFHENRLHMFAFLLFQHSISYICSHAGHDVHAKTAAPQGHRGARAPEAKELMTTRSDRSFGGGAGVYNHPPQCGYNNAMFTTHDWEW